SLTFIVLTLTSFAALVTVRALPQGGPPIPPPGLYCCPPYGPNGLPLAQPQPGPFALWCLYGENSLCGYDPSSGTGAKIEGCPPNAVPNPHPPTCP
ncbi:hypothetical protein DFP72DRAFT_875424, partial [Ephemerocybe angulata]